MYKYILKQMKRNIIPNALFCILLALAGTLICLGSGLLISAVNSVKDADTNFTSIALPGPSAINRWAVNQVESNGIREYDLGYTVLTYDDRALEGWFTQFVAADMTDKILLEIDEKIYKSGAIKTDTRQYFGAYIPGIVPMLESVDVEGFSANSAAFVVKCTDIEEVYLVVSSEDSGGEQRLKLQVIAYINFEVEQTLALHPDIKAPKTVWIQVTQRDADGGYFFEKGKRYVLSGDNYESGRIKHESVMPISGTTLVPDIGITDYSLVHDEVIGKFASPDELDKHLWGRLYSGVYSISEADFPLEVVASVYTGEIGSKSWFEIDSSYEEALESEYGTEIEYAVSVVEKSINRLNIFTTGNLNSYFAFNQNRANIADGRSISAEEYADGAKVCVIPTNLAKKNGLTVGDTISLYFFEGRYLSDNIYSTYGDFQKGINRYWRPGGYYKDTREAEEPIEFVIVGLYASQPPTIRDAYAIPLNTIFIPDNASPELLPASSESPAYLDDRADSPMLNGIIIQNGHNEEFKESINSLVPGYGNFFKIYDQGYSNVKGALDNLINSSTLIFVLCVSGFIISGLVFCLFFIMRKKKETGTLYALGISRKSRIGWVFIQCLIVIVVAQSIAFTASSVLYGRILDYATEMAIKESSDVNSVFSDTNIAEDGVKLELTILKDPLAIPLGIGGGAAALLLFSGSISAKIAGKDKKSFAGDE